MTISQVTSKPSYMPQALADLDANSKVADTAAGQQTAPAQNLATDTSSAAPSNSLKGLLPDPRIAAQLVKQQPAGNAQPSSSEQPKQSDNLDSAGSQSVVGSVTAMPHDEYEAKYNNAIEMLQIYGQFIERASSEGGRGGISHKDLEVAANDKSLPDEARNACQFLLDSRTAFTNLETKDKNYGVEHNPDGFIGWSDLNSAALERGLNDPNYNTPQYAEYYDKICDAIDQISGNFNAVRNASGKGGATTSDSGITRDDLEAIVNDEFADDDLRAACEFLMNSPSTFNYFETYDGRGDSRGDNMDGIIGRGDMDALYRSYCITGDKTGP